MTSHESLLIAGASTPTSHYEIFSPYNNTRIASIPLPDGEAVEQAMRNAIRSFEQLMKVMPAHHRADILYRASQLMKDEHEKLSRLIAMEGGKPLRDARVEVTRAINTVKMIGDEVLQLNGQTITMDRAPGTENCLAYTIRVPLGPTLAISAFNHPVNLICHQVCAAFVAGNSVVVKPASQTPLSCLRIVELLLEAGAPEEALSVLPIPGARAQALVSDSRFRFVSFIGSHEVGWNIRRTVAPGTRVALELGGTGTAIIDKTADATQVYNTLVRGAFYHAGQVCVSVQRCFVHEDRYEEVSNEIAQRAAKLCVGDPLSPDTDVGPLISQTEVKRVQVLVQEAVQSGAQLLCGGETVGETCYLPTVLANTSREMNIVREEVFGPVICLEPYSDIETIISELNESKYSFQTALYTKDVDLAHEAARRIETKALIVNDSTAFRVDWMPFGGARQSGLGTGGTKDSLLDLTEERLVVIRIANL